MIEDVSFDDSEISMYGEQLRYITDRYITPISRIIDHENGEHWGSASYFAKDGSKYIITNEHVARGRETHSLTHTFKDCDDIYRIRKTFYTKSAPVDIAIAEIEELIWNSSNHNSICIPYSRFANIHNPDPSEYLFLSGFSGEKSRFHFGHLFNPLTPFLTQAVTLPTDPRIDPIHHFALRFNPTEARHTGEIKELPDPHGMSGSLVWDTKIVYCKKNAIPWCCDYPVVTGIVWAWPTSDLCLIATKIEHLEIEKIIEVINKASSSEDADK